MSAISASPALEVSEPVHTQSLLRGRQIHIRPTMHKDLDEVYRRGQDLESRGLWFPVGVRAQAAFEALYAADGRWGEDLGIMHVIQNSDEALVGYVSFQRVVGDADEINVGYFTYPEFRGQGYASEATSLFVEFLFATRRDMNRAALYIHPDNAASIRLAERCGFTYEGRIREGWFNLGQWHDLLVYGLLRRELVGGRPPAPKTRD
jgi:[ribosomal protein S5]-alanine N-acetyltransferase